MLNVKYLVQATATCRFPPDPDLNMLCNDADHHLQVVRNEGYFPRAFFVDGVAPARDDEEFLDLLERVDLRRHVILLWPEGRWAAGQNFIPARVLRYRDQEVTVEVETPVAGHLVLSDSYFPGWEARVDGEQRRIWRANYLVRAVPVSPGAHEVVFSYRPWSWRIGRTVSVASGLLILGLVLQSCFFGRHKKRPFPVLRAKQSPITTWG
jgi:hypothetical protein